MRKIIILLSILVILPVFSVKSYANEQTDAYISEMDKLLPDSLSGITSDPDRLIDELSIEGLFSRVISAISGERGMLSTMALTLLACLILCALHLFIPSEGGRVVAIGSGLVCSVLIFGNLSELYGSMCRSVDELNAFFGSIIPLAASVCALGGNAGAAVAQSGGMYATLYILGDGGGRVLRSFVTLGLALGLLSPFPDSPALTVGRWVREGFTRALGILTLLIGAGFSLQTLVASSADSMTMRTVKYMASGLIPVVGSTVSGALSTLASGLSYAKGIIGASAVAAIVTIALAPLVALLCCRLLFSLAISLSECFSSACLGIFTAYRFALDVMISLYALTGLIYLFEIIIFIKTGVAIL